jgi:hypothetical protein
VTLFQRTADRAPADVRATTFAATHTLLGLAPDAGIEVLLDEGGSEN